MKEGLIQLLKSHAKEVANLRRSIATVRTPQIQQGGLKTAAHSVASRWFNEVKPALDTGNANDVATRFSSFFEQLMQLSRTRATRSKYLNLLDEITPNYQRELVHAAEIGAFSPVQVSSLAPYISGLPVEEGTYLDEAQRCFSVNALKGCVVLGWCATIARIHEKVAAMGYARFSKASEEMAARDYGRFKSFTKKFKVDSPSELLRVFDTDLLLVIEYLELIDSNQHQRLRTCFDLRNHSAHPGQAPVEPENVLAFYSDITKIVLKNPKFS
jgi:hypothetical protein